MNVLLITQEPPLSADEVVSGNAVRTLQIKAALESAGHQASQVWLARPGDGGNGGRGKTFRNRDELAGLLLAQRPDAVIVAYWELLALLPHETDTPVILDYVAPRTLEELFESPATVNASLRRFRNNLAKCSLVLVGNPGQRTLLINTMIEAGFDLSRNLPILVVPLGAELAGPPQSSPLQRPWCFVSGGVSWPWRNPGPYREPLADFARKHSGHLALVHFGGAYRWHENEAEEQSTTPDEGISAVEIRTLESYREFCRFLTRQAHVGIELAAWNIEREFSQSFRSLEFLRHGLPLLLNRYLPLARLVEKYDAGWLAGGPEDLPGLLDKIVSDPAAWQAKSANARRLVDEELLPAVSAAPLLAWLEAPEIPARLAPEIVSRQQTPVLGVPPLRERLKRQYALAETVALRRFLGHEKGDGVVIVTRGDLFPPDHGAAVRTVESARAIARLGVRVGIVTDDRKHWFEVGPEGIEPRPYPFWTRFNALPGPVAKLLHFTKDIPYSNSFLYLPVTDGSFFRRVLAAARATGAGTLHAEFPAYAKPCIKAREIIECPVVLVEHNVEYERIRAQVPELTHDQYERLKAIEIDLCNRSDAVVCVSGNDRQKLADDGVHRDLLHTIAHGVNLAEYDAAAVEDVRGRYAIPDSNPLLVYHGTYTYPPNREALQIFADILLPRLEQRGLHCHLLAVGKEPPRTPPHPRIHVTGSVAMLAPWLKAADIAVVPLVEGGGTRMKIIECFAAGLPLISTSKGIEGIPVEPGEQALVLDDWDEIIDAIEQLWRQPDKAAGLARAGRRMAEQLDWNAAAEKYRAIYAAIA